MFKNTAVQLIVIISISNIAFADTGPLGFGAAELKRDMETDRPDFTEGTNTIEAGHFQLETGYTFTSNDRDGVETESHTVPEVLLRSGLTEDLELRIAWDGWSAARDEVSGDSSRNNGFSDMSVGFKHMMYEQSESLPALSIMLELGLPTGAERKTSDDVEPSFSILWAKDIQEGTALAGNFNFAGAVNDERDRYFETSSSLTVAHNLNAKLGAYAEYYGFYIADNQSKPQHYLNGGFTYALCNNLQLDIRSGFGLNEEADDFLAGAGISVRY